eukprot:TRINITY_DN3002_c0_g1_i1.p1 TRINITY_DN3002_c0_g1~~TRINITY_DN3002_c0_g1_i1.p1  ORF type:complete len:480 (-),score=57.27 TRINITY_DN3002_c0_g1_i1:20-1459(-)
MAATSTRLVSPTAASANKITKKPTSKVVKDKGWKASLGLLGRATGRTAKLHFQPGAGDTSGEGADVAYKPSYNLQDKRVVGGVIGKKDETVQTAAKISMEAIEERKVTAAKMGSRAYEYDKGEDIRVKRPTAIMEKRQIAFSFTKTKTGREIRLLTRGEREQKKEERHLNAQMMAELAEADKRKEELERKRRVEKMTGIAKSTGRGAPINYIATCMVVPESPKRTTTPPKKTTRKRRTRSRSPENKESNAPRPQGVSTFDAGSDDNSSISSTESERVRMKKQNYVQGRRRAAKIKGPDFESTAMRDNSSFFRHDTAAPDKMYEKNYSQQTFNVHGATWCRQSGRLRPEIKRTVSVDAITHKYEKKQTKQTQNNHEFQYNSPHQLPNGKGTLKPPVYKPSWSIPMQTPTARKGKMISFTDRWSPKNPQGKLPPLVALKKFEAALATLVGEEKPESPKKGQESARKYKADASTWHEAIAEA